MAPGWQIDENASLKLSRMWRSGQSRLFVLEILLIIREAGVWVSESESGGHLNEADLVKEETDALDTTVGGVQNLLAIIRPNAGITHHLSQS